MFLRGGKVLNFSVILCRLTSVPSERGVSLKRRWLDVVDSKFGNYLPYKARFYSSKTVGCEADSICMDRFSKRGVYGFYDPFPANLSVHYDESAHYGLKWLQKMGLTPTQNYIETLVDSEPERSRGLQRELDLLVRQDIDLLVATSSSCKTKEGYESIVEVNAWLFVFRGLVESEDSPFRFVPGFSAAFFDYLELVFNNPFLDFPPFAMDKFFQDAPYCRCLFESPSKHEMQSGLVAIHDRLNKICEALKSISQKLHDQGVVEGEDGQVGILEGLKLYGSGRSVISDAHIRNLNLSASLRGQDLNPSVSQPLDSEEGGDQSLPPPQGVSIIDCYEKTVDVSSVHFVFAVVKACNGLATRPLHKGHPDVIEVHDLLDLIKGRAVAKSCRDSNVFAVSKFQIGVRSESFVSVLESESSMTYEQSILFCVGESNRNALEIKDAYVRLRESVEKLEKSGVIDGAIARQYLDEASVYSRWAMGCVQWELTMSEGG